MTPQSETGIVSVTGAQQDQPALVTRQQAFMRAALDHVQGVKGDGTIDPKLYGGLCHKLPILVRVNGLCQTLAFIADKATGEPGDAKQRPATHARLLDHVAELLVGEGAKGDQALTKVRDASLTEYMFLTRRLMEAWVFYKRFAVSVLDVKNAAAAEDGA